VARSDRRYRAFISYSHADNAAGARLFARIDGFRPPKGLIGSEGAFGPVPPKLYPCFRDREELAVSRDVKTSLDTALHNSDHLVVLCSPAAAKSQWIAHEIRSFARHRGADRIHVVLASGEPSQCLPPALAEVGLQNPLAADLREHADGWKVGSLKTIATILGLPFGELRDREAARIRGRRRAVATVSALFATVLLGGCGAGWVALDRDERLQQVFVDVMRQISARAGHAYDQQGITLTTEDVEHEIDFTRGLTRIAFNIAPDSPRLVKEEMRLAVVYARYLMSVGKSVDALAAAEHSDVLCNRHRDLCQNDEEAGRLQAVSLRTQAAIVLLSTRDRDAGARLHGSERLLARRTDSDSRRELALTYQAMGALAERAGNFEGTTRRYTQAAEIFRELRTLTGATREQRHDEIVLLEALGDAALARDRYDEARSHYADANVLATRLADERSDLQANRTVYVTHDRLGLVALKAGDAAEASRHFELARTLAIALIARDPDNIELRRDIVVARLQGSRAAASQGLRDQADVQAQLAYDEARDIAATDPTNVRLAADVGRAEILLAVLRSGNDLRDLWDGSALRNDDVELAATFDIELSQEVATELHRQRMQRMRPREHSPSVSAPE
jgi:tetratricopeptide (TPR) repeat protein